MAGSSFGEGQARLLLKARFGCLPVIDANRNVIGIVTEHDFMKILAGEDA